VAVPELRHLRYFVAVAEAAFANAVRAGHGVLGTLRLGSSPAARHEIRPALLAKLRERHPGIAVDASEATTGNLCREHGFEPQTLVAPAVWEDAEWPAGDDLVTLATERIARHAAPRMTTALLVPALYLPLELVWREDDDSPVLRSFLDVATPEPAHGS
jgi:hypothetical protein